MPVFREVTIPGLILIAIAVYYFQTRHLPVTSSIFPYVVMAAMGVFAIAIILNASVRAYRASGVAQSAEPEDSNQLLVSGMVALSAGFVALLYAVGFVIATPIFLIAAFLFLGVKPLSALIIGVCGTAVYYLLFSVLLGLNL